MPAGCFSAGSIGCWDRATRRRWIRGGCRCGRPTCAASAHPSTTPTVAGCSTAWISPTMRRSLRRAAYEASGFVVRQLIELSQAKATAHRGRRWRYQDRAVDAGHRRRHRSAGAGIRSGRGGGVGRGIPRPDGGRSGVVDHRRCAVGHCRARRRTRSGLDGPDGGTLPPVSRTGSAVPSASSKPAPQTRT